MDKIDFLSIFLDKYGVFRITGFKNVSCHFLTSLRIPAVTEIYFISDRGGVTDVVHGHGQLCTPVPVFELVLSYL